MFISGNLSLFQAVFGFFVLGFLGALVGGALNIIGGIKKKKARKAAEAKAKADKAAFERQQREMERQLAQAQKVEEAAQKKKTMTTQCFM